MNFLDRSLLILSLTIALTACSSITKSYPPSATIGSTQADIDANTKYYEGHPDSPESVGIIGKDNKLHMSTGFENGICNRIKYTSATNQKISPYDLSVILALNSKGVAWIVEDRPESNGTIYYHTVDGKLRARLTDGTSLFIVTDIFFRKSMAETNAKGLKGIKLQQTQPPNPSNEQTRN